MLVRVELHTRVRQTVAIPNDLVYRETLKSPTRNKSVREPVGLGYVEDLEPAEVVQDFFGDDGEEGFVYGEVAQLAGEGAGVRGHGVVELVAQLVDDCAGEGGGWRVEFLVEDDCV